MQFYKYTVYIFSNQYSSQDTTQNQHSLSITSCILKLTCKCLSDRHYYTDLNVPKKLAFNGKDYKIQESIQLYLILSIERSQRTYTIAHLKIML